MKTADECNQKPPANPVVFAVSFLGRIAVVQYPFPLIGLPPEWDDAPENALSGRESLHDHLEAPVIEHGNEFVIRDWHQKPLPASVATPALPLGGSLDSLHCARQAQDFGRTGQEFKPHELVVLIPATIPAFE
jgi:hypothetical protein